jgi:protein TonB
VHTKPKSAVSITKAKSREKAEMPPEPAPISENMHYAEAAKESPPAKTTPPPSGTGSASQGGNAISGSGISGKGNAPGGSGGNGHGQGTGSGTGTGSAAGSGTGTVEGKFGTSSGPSFIHRVKPSYPRRAQVLGKEGTVVLRLTVDRTGTLSRVEVVAGAGFGFDEEAVRVVRSSTFSPAVRNGHPVTCVAELSVRFKLESSG